MSRASTARRPTKKAADTVKVVTKTNSKKRKKPEPKPARIILANWLRNWNVDAYGTDLNMGWSFFWVDFIEKCLDVTGIEPKKALTLNGVKELLIYIFEE